MIFRTKYKIRVGRIIESVLQTLEIYLEIIFIAYYFPGLPFTKIGYFFIKFLGQKNLVW